MDSLEPTESFRSQLLRYRSRTRLTQRQFAARVGVHPRSVQEWEAGANYPTTERLRGLIAALLESGGLAVGQEANEAEALWMVVRDESTRMHAPFDRSWFVQLLSERRPPAAPSAYARLGRVDVGSGAEPGQDWGEAPETVSFVDRTDELAALRGWVLDERCRLIALLGMGGIGKTSLAAKVAKEVAPDFERIHWRSLRDAPPLGDWLASAVGFLSDQQLVPPTTESERIAILLQLLRQKRCLLVLDNSEVLFQAGQREGHYREGMAAYGRLLQAVAEASHQSCLLLTSREAPPELALLTNHGVRTFELGGLGADDAELLLAPKQLAGSSQQWGELNRRFGGNGLALKVVGETIRELFDGDIGDFLEETGAGGVFGDIRRLLAQQVDRSSVLEQQVLRVLAVDREPVTVSELLDELGPRVGRRAVLEAVEALRRRSLVLRAETIRPAAFTLQSVVLEYVTDRLVTDAAAEIRRGEPRLLVQQPLIKAHSKDYVRQSQERLIGAATLQQVRANHGDDGTERRLLALLDSLRGLPAEQQGYGPGNVVDLLRLLRDDLRGLDLSRLAIRQAYLAEVEAQDASLAGAHLSESVLADAFYFPPCIALSADGALLAAGTSTGEVWLWRVADRTPLWVAARDSAAMRALAVSANGRVVASGHGDGTVRLWDAESGRELAALQGPAGTIRGVALSADGNVVASSGGDATVCVWEVGTGRALATLEGHSGAVWGVALSADGALVATGGEDQTVRLWQAATGQPVATLLGHTGRIRKVAVSAAGDLVASAGGDGTVRLWQTESGQPLATLQGHTNAVWGVALSADGHQVVSGGSDGTVRLWEVSTGRPLATLLGHNGTVWDVAVSADGRLVASGGGDGTARLWEAATGRSVATFQGHPGAVWDVALSADGHLAASGGEDGILRLWDTRAGRLLAPLRGHVGAIRGVALSADGHLLASGGGDGTVRLWDPRSASLHGAGPRSASSAGQAASGGRVLATLQGHTGTVLCVSLSSDGHLMASGGEDGTVRLWATSSGRPVATLHGHAGGVWSVALSADGQLVVSGGEDGTVRLWDAGTGGSLATLLGHVGGVWGVALSVDGRLLASVGGDGTVRLWETATGRSVATLEGHTGPVFGVALSHDCRLLASGEYGGTVRLWDASAGRSLATLLGHTGTVWGVALSDDGQLLATGGFDGTVKLWNTETGSAVRTLQPERRYERLDITGLTGISEAQRQALIALGAVDRLSSPPGSELAESRAAASS